jgi:hypothetical protein
MADGQLVPGDEAWPADRALLSELTPVIARLSQYVMRYWDADAGQATAVSVADEQALAEQVARVAATMHARAQRREILDKAPLCVEGEATQPPALERGPDLGSGP